jgi:chromosome segregation ATPase
MDRELIAYLDQRFAKIDERFAKIDERFAQIDERFAKIDQRLEKIDGRLDKLESRMERLEESVQQTQVTQEHLSGEVRILAEGVIGVEEKLQALRMEMTHGFDRLEASIAPYYADLNRRVRALEERAAREGQAPLDIIRERYGKAKAT